MEWLRNLIGDEFWYHAIKGVVLVVVFIAMSKVVRSILQFVGTRWLRHTPTALDDRMLAIVLRSVRMFMILIGLHMAVREVRKGVDGSGPMANQLLDYAASALYIIVVFVVTRVIVQVLKAILEWYMERLPRDGAADALKKSLPPLLGRLTSIVVSLVGLMVVLDHFEVDISSLLVSLGVGSLAIALAAQDTLSNMIAGFVIMIDRPFRVGDRIILPSGSVGDVQEIGMRSTRVLDFDENLIIIPNAELVKSHIVNLAFPHQQMVFRVRFGVSYGTDPQVVRRILLAVAHQHPDVVKDVPAEVYCTALGDSAMEFTLVARTADYTRRFTTEAAIRESGYVELTRAGIEIPFPQRVVTMKSGT